MTSAETRPATDLVADCTLLAARLAHTLRRPGCTREDVQQVLAAAPEGRLDLVALVLAGWVDRDLEVSTTGQVLAWNPPPQLPGGPPTLPREHGSRRGYRQHRAREEDPCAECSAAWAVSRRPAACQQEYARLRSVHVSVLPAAELSRAVHVLSRPSRPEESL